MLISGSEGKAESMCRRYPRGVFEPLLDDCFFRRVRVSADLGTIVWPNGADLCPDVLYSVASGQPIVIERERVTA